MRPATRVAPQWPSSSPARSIDSGRRTSAFRNWRMNSRVVGNDVTADGKPMVMITGANQGGKSTFLRSVGQAQLMAQAECSWERAP